MPILLVASMRSNKKYMKRKFEMGQSDGIKTCSFCGKMVCQWNHTSKSIYFHQILRKDEDQLLIILVYKERSMMKQDIIREFFIETNSEFQ